MIQRAQTIKTTHINMAPDDLEEAIPTKKTATAKLDNMRLYAIMKKFCDTTMWVHTKNCARDRDGRRAMIAMQVNSVSTNAIENRYSEIQDKIRNILYHGEKTRWGINRYVLEHKKCHEERYQLVTHGHHDFTEREKVYCLLRGTKVHDLEATIPMIESV